MLQWGASLETGWVICFIWWPLCTWCNDESNVVVVCSTWGEGALLLCPCSFCPSDNVWRSRRADEPRCAHFSILLSHLLGSHNKHLFFTLLHNLFKKHHTTNISRQVHASRSIGTSGGPNDVQNCQLDKTNVDKTSQHPKWANMVKTTQLFSAHFKSTESKSPQWFHARPAESLVGR